MWLNVTVYAESICFLLLSS